MTELPPTLSCPPHLFLHLCARAGRGEFDIWMWEAKVWYETGKKTPRGKPERFSKDGWTAHVSWPQNKRANDGTPEPECCGPMCVLNQGGQQFARQAPRRTSRSQRELSL